MLGYFPHTFVLPSLVCYLHLPSFDKVLHKFLERAGGVIHGLALKLGGLTKLHQRYQPSITTTEQQEQEELLLYLRSSGGPYLEVG